MVQGLGISEIINIDTTISSGGIGPADFGTGLLLVNDTTLSAAGENKIRRFSSYDEVTKIINNETVRQEAAIWFAADPSPKALYIARIVEEGLGTQGFSKKLVSADITDLNNKTDWSMKVNGYTVDGIDPAAATGEAVANAIQTQLIDADNALSTSTVTFSSTTGRLTFTLKGASDAPFTEPMVVTKALSGSDLGSKLGFIPAEGDPPLSEGFLAEESDSIGAYYKQGHLSQGVHQALSEVIGFASDGRPTNIMVSDTVSTTISGASPEGKFESLREFVKNSDCITAFVENGKSTVFANSGNVVAVGSEIAKTNASNQNKVMAIYSEASEAGTSNRRVDIAVLAKLSSQDFDQPQSIVTLVPKSLPHVAPTNTLSSGQIKGLNDANASVYTTVGGYHAFLGGKVSNGTWIDAQYWLAWLKNEMELNIYNAMRQSSRFDNIELTDTIHQVMAKAINTGGIKLGGKVNAAMKKEIRIVTNNPGFDGVLQNGYLLYITPYSSLTDLDRNSRSQSFKVWISPSEAIHSVAGTIVLNG